MRRILSLFTMLMLCSVLAFAQSRVVSGKVTDKDGSPVSFASVKVRGTRTGIAADANGAYTIRVKAGDLLEISNNGYNTIEVPVGNLTVINTVLEKNNKNLETVVITTGAFGIRQNARNSSANVQVVTAEKLNTVRAADVNNAIAGKVAGAQVRSQTSGKLGAASSIRLRGENGFGGGSGPIYVVDGTILPNSNDVNTDDVEDITVLQGPAASALFGTDGLNGAIVINTKKARRNRGMGLEINSGITFDNVYILPHYQNSYAGGDGPLSTNSLIQYHYEAGQPEGWKALDGKYYHDYVNDASWGPRMSGQEYIPWYAWYPGSEYSFKTAKLTPQPDNIREFYNTGVTATNNINFSKSGEGYSMRLSYTNLDIKSIIPTQWLKRNTLTSNFSFDLNTHFSVAANITYIAQNRNAENDDSYGNQSSGSFSSWFHRDLDMNIVRNLQGLVAPNGSLASWNHGNPDGTNDIYTANYWLNFYSYFNNVLELDRRDRIFGDASVTYKANNDLKFRLTYRKQQLTTVGTETYSSLLQNSISQGQFNPFEANSKAGYAVSNSYSDRQNIEFLTSYNKKINKDFSVNAYAGFDILKTRSRTYNANTIGGLVIPGIYSLSNSVSPITNSYVAGGAQEYVDQSHRNSLFARADAGYKNFLFIDASYRRDYYSTENPSKPYIDAKSGGASFVFSDLIKKTIPFISYGKIRGSIGQIINPLAIYQLNSGYTLSGNQWNGNPLSAEPNTQIDPSLHGATNTEKEIGLEMRFAKNRFGFSATYYDRSNTEFPTNVGVTPATGYTALSTNVGEIKKNGIELQAFVQLLNKKNITWDISGTWGRLLENKIVSISSGITALNFPAGQGSYAGTYAPYISSVVGQPWGQLVGIGKLRINGQPVLDAAGKYVKQDNVNFGSVLPDYTGGVQTSLTVFKNFVVNVNIDYSWGGKFFSLSDYWGTGSGLTARTAGLNDKGNPVRDAVEDGGGVHVSGVDATGKPVSYYVDARTYFHQFQDGTHISEESIYDLSFVKMREVSIGYKIPVEKSSLGKLFNYATFSILVRNPWLIYAKTHDQDPSEISGLSGENGQIPGTRSIGVNLKVGF